MSSVQDGWHRRSVMAGIGAAALLPGPARATSSSGPITSPLALEKQRLLIAAALNGVPKAYIFVVDTGAGFAYLRPEIARELKLSVIGSHIVSGIGGKQAQGERYLARQVVFGGDIRQNDVIFDGYDFGRGIPPDAAGLLSGGLFTTRDSDLDFERGEWRLWPSGRPDRDGFDRLDAIISRPGTPSARMAATAYIDGQAYRFALDTGDPGDLLLFPQAARRSGLFADTIPFAPEPTGGFGGRASRPSRRVRAKLFQFGPVSLDRPLVTVMDPGDYNGMEWDGLIGIDVLRLLTLSTEVRNGRLWAARNRTAPATPTYRRAGLWLDRASDGGAVVSVVGTGSPAAQAGLRKADRLVSPAGFEEAIRAIGGPVGRQVALRVARGGDTLDLHYTLSDWL